MNCVRFFLLSFHSYISMHYFQLMQGFCAEKPLNSIELAKITWKFSDKKPDIFMSVFHFSEHSIYHLSLFIFSPAQVDNLERKIHLRMERNHISMLLHANQIKDAIFLSVFLNWKSPIQLSSNVQQNIFLLVSFIMHDVVHCLEASNVISFKVM